jgi:SAM-dependent methyltransferase
MKIYRLRSLSEYQAHLDKTQVERDKRNSIQKNLIDQPSVSLGDKLKTYLSANKVEPDTRIKAYSYTAGAYVDFIVSPKRPVNWRETLKCPKSNLINRVRASIHIMDTECAPYASDSIYLMEQKTSTYQFLKKRYPELIGSEYLGDDVEPGQLINGLRHEDATRLSFADESLDHILSFDVFEHVPNYLSAFRECYRTLKPGGCLLWSVPMARRKHNNIVRAEINDDGTISHLLEPEYHGDPVKKQGILCFYHFGWEMLDQIREIGFSDVYATIFWSREFAYLGDETALFIARK